VLAKGLAPLRTALINREFGVNPKLSPQL